MTALHSINDPRRELRALLAEQQGEPSYRNPARRSALMIAQRITEDDGWHHNNENAVQFMRGMAFMARKMGWSSSIHPDLRRWLIQIADLAGKP